MEDTSILTKKVFMYEDKICKKSVRFKAREEKGKLAGFSNLYVSKTVIPKGCKKVKVIVKFYGEKD
jgi:hypothetical protein